MDRRFFLKTATAFAGIQFLPRNLLAQSPNGKLNVAQIGVGGMGGTDLGSVASHAKVNIAALCDTDANTLNGRAKNHPSAERFADFREMLVKMGDRIDAVVVSVPDHSHAPAAMSAMNLNKHVYCQKPLTHEIYEARRLREVAAEKKLVTQMGIQIHSHIAYRMATDMVQSGVLGKVSQVYAWSNKNWGSDAPAPQGEDPVPDHLDWNLWLGVTASRPYKKGVYHPGDWRRTLDHGCGTLGDMGVHIFDTPYRALKLTAPNWVKTTCRPPTGFGHPTKNLVTYEFPQTEYTTEKLIWTWCDGAFAPPKDQNWELREGQSLPAQGAMFVGEEGYLLLPHVGGPQLFPLEKFRDVPRPKLPTIDHYHSWVDACMGIGTPSANFDYAGPLTEALLLGVVANRFPDTELRWDAANLRVTNLADANTLIRRPYRKGFEVPNLS